MVGEEIRVQIPPAPFAWHSVHCIRPLFASCMYDNLVAVAEEVEDQTYHIIAQMFRTLYEAPLFEGHMIEYVLEK